MSISADDMQLICNKISAEVAAAYDGLKLFFVIHGKGKLRESIALAEHEIISHPAGNAARAIIRKHSHGERSSFLGLAIASESKMLGFKQKDHLLALFTINKDHFNDMTEAAAQIYHLVWHAIDLHEIRQEPKYKKKFKTGPMVPKRSALNFAKANLQADVFAGVMSILKAPRDKLNPEMVKLIAQKRGVMSLAPVTDYKAENFPSVIATESCEFVVRDLIKNRPPTDEHITTARQLSLDVGQAFDEENIKQWWDFSIPAQDMAWRGFSKQEILGAAVNTSDNPFVRSIGYLIQEVTGLEAASATTLEHSYNAFLDPEANLQLHREMIDTVFQDAIEQGVEEKSSQALINAANKQNENLTEGRILGWCANALQDAARAFERALLNNSSPDQAARMHFEGNKTDLTSWDSLRKLGDDIIDQKRQGFAVTMGHIAEICHNNPAFAPVLDSLKMTMNDPSYIQKLQAANDFALTPTAPAPKAPSRDLGPKGPAPKGPEVELGPSAPQAAPALGGNTRAGQRIRQQQEILRRQQQDDDNSTSEE